MIFNQQIVETLDKSSAIYTKSTSLDHSTVIAVQMCTVGLFLIRQCLQTFSLFCWPSVFSVCWSDCIIVSFFIFIFFTPLYSFALFSTKTNYVLFRENLVTSLREEWVEKEEHMKKEHQHSLVKLSKVKLERLSCIKINRRHVAVTKGYI